MSDSGKITIRDVEDSDIRVFFEQQLDAEASRMAAFIWRNSHDRAAFDAHWARILNLPDVVNKTILWGEEIAGHVACFPHEGKFEVTYWIGKDYWGKGIATEALKKLLQEIAHRPIFGRTAKDNIGSIRVLEKCDFKIIGEDKGYAQARDKETEEYILRLDD